MPMRHRERLFSLFKRGIYSVAALALVLISIAMIAAAGLDILSSVDEGRALKQSLLDGIGLVVVSLAVFDVAKYLMEARLDHDPRTHAGGGPIARSGNG
jgi:TctA family transporter